MTLLRPALVVLIFTLTSVIAPTPSSPAAAINHSSYQIETLETLGGSSSRAYGINATGLVVGHADDAQGRRRAVIWRDGIPQDLGTLGGDHATAIAINDAGQIVGSSTTAPGQQLGDPGDHAVLWQNSAALDLGTLGGDSSAALDINASGMVVGASTTRRGIELAFDAQEGVHAFIWRTGSMTSLGTLGGDFSFAMAINDAGQVVGISSTADGVKHAFLWQDGEMTDLGAPGSHMSAALDINGRQHIVGFTKTSTGMTQPLLWVDDRMHPFDAAALAQATAFAVNEHGVAVGQAEAHRALIWIDGHYETIIPPGRGWDDFDIARNINNMGQIVGWGHRNGEIRAFLLTPRDDLKA